MKTSQLSPVHDDDVSATQSAYTTEQIRRYLASVLHDDAIQLGCHIERLLRNTLADIADTDHSYTSLREAAMLINTLVDNLRGLVTKIYSPQREMLEFLPALQKLLQSIEQSTDLRCTLTGDASLDGKCIDDRRMQVLYKIAHEAIINAVKHAHATTLRVVLDYDEVHLSLLVQDNGRGFTPLPASELLISGHIGLFLLQEYVQQLSGTCQIETHPGMGTTVTVHLSLHSDESEGRG